MQGDLGLARASVVVGREPELDLLRTAVGAARTGGTTCVLLVGEGGIGKTRLLGEAATVAAGLGLAVLSGRAPIAATTAFGLVSDALRSWLRAHPATDPLEPFDRGLGLVLPEWPVVAPGELDAGQRRLLAHEGVVHLLRSLIATTDGAVLVLDDLHAADAESVEMVRYVAAARLRGLTVISALRPNESPEVDEVVRQLQRDGVATVTRVSPLDERAVADLVAALLDANPPSPLVADILARTDGVPLLVEEVLHGHVHAGTVEVGDDGAMWHGGAARVPRTISDLVDARLAALEPIQRQVLIAGAVVGDFDPSVMRATADADDAEISDALSAGVRVGLIEMGEGSVAFRHAIIREAVLAGAVPHLIDTMHRRVAEELRNRAALDAPALERLARHLTAIDERDEAAVALVVASSHWQHDHALLAAEHAARLARETARDPSTRADATDALAQSLTSQGRWSDALELDESTVSEHGDDPSRRLRRATCAVEIGRPEVAAEVLVHARESGDDSPELALLDGRLAVVLGDAESALAVANQILQTATGDIDTRLAALDLQARAFDFLGERDAARDAWSRQARDAAAAGRTQSELRAVVQLGKLELFAGVAPQRLYEAVALARDAGALVELGWAQENLGIALAVGGDTAGAMAVFDEAIGRCRAFRLDQEAYLHVARAMTRSYREEQIDEEMAEAEALLPTPDLLLHSTTLRAAIAVRRAQWDEATSLLQRAVELARAMPGAVPMDNACWLPLALAACGRWDEAEAAIADARALPDLERFYSRPVVLGVAEAVLARDEGAVDAAIAAAAGPMPGDIAVLLVVSAHVLGGPARARWLRDALDIYEAIGAPLDADRVRQWLREAGGAVPRRRSARAAVPLELVDAGVTAREAEVLRLVARGQPNAEIAEQLFVSVRTVESHVSSLLTKLGGRNRGELAVRATTIDFDSVT